MKRIIAILLTLALLTAPLTVQAKTVNRYTTQAVSLRERSTTKARAVYKVKANTKVALIKTGKVWAQVRYRERTLSVQKKYLATRNSPKLWTIKKFRRRGVIRWNGWKWTWYSQRAMPGRGLKIPGRHIENGFVCDKDGYICLASGRNNKRKKAIVPTPFGKFGRVYDTNGRNNNKWGDVYLR